MAYFTCQPSVFSIQFEYRLAVVKALFYCFKTVMAPETIHSISLVMGCQEGAVNLLMAGTADRSIKTGNIDCMAINAGKSQTIASFSV